MTRYRVPHRCEDCGSTFYTVVEDLKKVVQYRRCAECAVRFWNRIRAWQHP